MTRLAIHLNNRTQGRASRLAVVVCVVICVSTLWLELRENTAAVRWSAQQLASAELLPGSPVSVSVSGNRKSTLHFRIGSTQYFRIEVQSSPAEVSLSLYGPDRRVHRSNGCRIGVNRISEIAKTAGEYRLELNSCDRELDSEFQINLTTRTASGSDRLRVAAERALEDADRLVRARPNQPSAGLLGYERALATWRTIRDRVEEVGTLQTAGNLYRDSGNFARALEYFEHALELAEAERLEIDRAGILRAIATIHLRNGNATRASEYSLKALEVSRSSSDRNGEAEGLLVLGDIYYFSSDYSRAADADSQAYSIWEGLRYRRGQARSLLELAAIDSDRNEFTQAFDHAQRAHSLFGALDDDIGRARSSSLIGHVLSSKGRKQEALESLEQAKPVLMTSGDLTSQAGLLNATARIYADLGDYDSALSFSKLALEKYRTLANRVLESITLRVIGHYYLAAGDLPSAKLFLERALKGFQILSNTRAEAFCWLDLGLVDQSLGDTQGALDSLNKSLEMSRVTVDRRLEASVLLALGRVREAAGDNAAAALQFYRDSLRLHTATENRLGEITALYHIASCLQRMGEIGSSIANSEAAIEIIETLRTSLASSGLRTFYFASARQHFDLYIDSIMRGQGGAGPDASKAFEVAERSRARTLLESLVETRVSISGNTDLIEREASLRAAIDAKSERYTALLSVNPGSNERAKLSDELRRLNAEYDELQGQLKLQNPQYAALVQPQPLKLSEVQQQVLDNDSLLLEYALGDENSYLWVISRDSLASYPLPNRSEIETKVRRYRDFITARLLLSGEKQGSYQARVRAADAQYAMAAAELSQMLLGAVGDLGKRRLLIVADGMLQYLPFGALPTPQSLETSNPVPLIVEHEVVNLPSASTLAVIRREAPLRGNPDRTIAVFADPVFEAKDPRVLKTQRPVSFATANQGRTTPLAGTTAGLNQTFRSSDAVGIRPDLPRLPFTGQEAEAILAIVPADQRLAALGFGATREAARDPDLKRYRFVHFATHTVLNDDHPDLSSLVLSLVNERGVRQNGFLRLRDIYNLRLSAELVVLSACETALGKEVKGEGLLSMVRGFMYSGTPRVLASLWKVDDLATAELMKEFYKQLLESRLTPAAALRQAQIAQMQKKSRQSPYYWAGFQLHGEWK